jgi:hypothetical protein
MDIIKGFVNITAYLSNVPGQTALLGELSTWSKTYSLEKGYYEDTSVAGYQLVTFKAASDTSNTEFELSTGQAKQILEVANAMVAYATSHIRPYDTQDFVNTISSSFFGRISDLQFGDYVDNGALALPEWVSWTNNEFGDGFVKIWFADQAFQTQYEEYTIKVVPPLEPLDNFFFGYGQVVSLLNAVTPVEFLEKIQAIKGDSPETYVRALAFNFINTANPAQFTASNWGVVIYGYAGDNIDNIKDAIVEYVLANSTHARSEWEQILPDLFKRTEFSVLPRWDQISIENLNSLGDLYSSIMEPLESLQFAKDAINYYSDQFIEQNIELFPFDYKALVLTAVSGDNNVAGTDSLRSLFPDYIPVPSTSTDFGRMSLKTQNWIIFMERLIMAAETATQYSSIPTDLRKQTKGGILFISKIYEGVNYLVACKSNSIYS